MVEKKKYYIGSADWMPRNLDNRIEVAAPVYDKEIQADLKTNCLLRIPDTAKGRIVDGTGENREKRTGREQCPIPLTRKNYITNTRIHYDKYEES